MIKLLKVARPQFLTVGLTLFVLGALWAVLLGAVFSPLRLLLGYLVILPAQLSVHFSNDYFDIASDRPGGTTLISGGGGILLENLALREPVKWIAITLILLSMGMGIVFMWIYSYPFWMIGFVILGNLAGWFYSAPPMRLSHRGLGEICYAFFARFLIPSMGYLVVTETLDLNGIFFLIPLTLYGFVSILSKRQMPLDFRALGLLSLLPLGVEILGIARRSDGRESSTRIATRIVIMLAVFSIFVDGYLFYLTVR